MKKELEILRNQINDALKQKGVSTRVELRGAYGKVGLDDVSGERCNHNITPLMSKPALIAYMRAALDGIYLFK